MKNTSSKLAKIIFILLSSLLFPDVNFSEHISPIIYNNCTECHRPGEIGAFLPLSNSSILFRFSKNPDNLVLLYNYTTLFKMLFSIIFLLKDNNNRISLQISFNFFKIQIRNVLI